MRTSDHFRIGNQRPGGPATPRPLRWQLLRYAPKLPTQRKKYLSCPCLSKRDFFPRPTVIVEGLLVSLMLAQRVEMPDNVSAAALAMAVAGSGTGKSVKTTPLLS